MSRARDSYRTRVLTAIKQTTSKMLQGPARANLTKKVMESAWGKKHILRPPYGAHFAAYSFCESAAVYPNDMDFVHALAHHMVDNQDERISHHGPEFCQALLEATRRWLGDDRAAELRKNLLANKAKIRSWSPEARERAKARYAERSFDSAADELRAMLAELEAD